MVLLFGRGILIFALIIAVAASIAQKVLNAPLLEVGEIWLDGLRKLHTDLGDFLSPVVDINSYIFYISLPIICVVLYYGYQLLFTPLNRIKTLGEVGYIPDGKFTLKEIATNVAKRRQVGEIPPVYPNGWFGVMESFMLKTGESKTTSIIGQQLALFRDSRGEAQVLDAYCPHMGANLAAGGRVKGDCIECPFHGWKFRGSDGKCVSIPYSDSGIWKNIAEEGLSNNNQQTPQPLWKFVEQPLSQCPFDLLTQNKNNEGELGSWPANETKPEAPGQRLMHAVPSVAKVKSWPSCEVNGWICIWYHAEGLDPTWQIPVIEGIMSGNLTYGGRTEHYINAHIEEIPENGADVAHLQQVHAPVIAAGVDLASMWTKYLSFACHKWTAEWKQKLAPEEHIGSLKLTHDLQFFGVGFPPVFIDMVAQQIGPGIVYLEFKGFFGEGVYVQHLTPVEPMVQKLVHNLYMHWAVPNVIRKFFMIGESIQVERDLMIWNNKRYNGRPVFAKSAEDSLVARHRRWYSQFYSEHSPRLTFQKENLDW